MVVTCPQCQTEQQISMEEASRFWAMCSTCGMVHGPATAKAVETVPQAVAAIPLGGQLADSPAWATPNELFEDILGLESEEEEGDSPDAAPRPPDEICVEDVAPAEEVAPLLTAEVSPEASTQDEGGTPPLVEAEEVIDLSQLHRDLSEPEPYGTPPVAFMRQEPAPCGTDADADDADVFLISPLWLPGEGGSRPVESAEPPAQPAADAPQEVDAEVGPHPTPEPPVALHPAQPPQSESEVEVIAAPPPVPSTHFEPPTDAHAVGALTRRRPTVWLLLGGVGLVGLLCAAFFLMSWRSEPSGADRSKASQTASGTPKKATNQSPANVPTSPPAGVNSANGTAGAGAAEGHNAGAQTAEAAQPVAVAPPAQEHGGGVGEEYTAQVASFSNVSDANTLVSTLRAAGFEARTVEAEVPGRGVWYRVQCGRFGTREEATRLGAQLRSKGLAQQVIATEVQKQ